MRTAIRLLLVVLGCSLSASAEEAPNAHGRVFAVRTGVSEQRTVARRLVKTGSITAPVNVEIAPRVSGGFWRQPIVKEENSGKYHCTYEKEYGEKPENLKPNRILNAEEE